MQSGSEPTEATIARGIILALLAHLGRSGHRFSGHWDEENLLGITAPDGSTAWISRHDEDFDEAWFR